MPAARACSTRLAGSLWLPRVELAAVMLAVLVLTIATTTAASAALVLAGAVRVVSPVPAWVTLLGLAAVVAPAIGQVTLAKLSFDVVVRSVVVDVFVVVLAVQATGLRGPVRATVIGGVVLAALATAGYLLRRLDADQPAAAWRILSVARPRWWRSRHQGVRLLGLAAAGPLLALLGDHVGLTGFVGSELVIATVLIAVAVQAWVVVGIAVNLHGDDGSTGADDDLRMAMLGAWTVFAPEVVVHFGGPDSSTHVVTFWTPSLVAIPQPGHPRAAGGDCRRCSRRGSSACAARGRCHVSARRGTGRPAERVRRGGECGVGHPRHQNAARPDWRQNWRDENACGQDTRPYRMTMLQAGTVLVPHRCQPQTEPERTR